MQDISRNLIGNEDRSFIGKISNAPVAKQILGAADKSASLLFDKGQRWIKTTDFQGKISDWIAKNPDATPAEFTKAAQGYAKEVNAAYGGLNWESIGVSKTAQKALRFVLLAPDWTISNLQLGKFALGGGTEGAAARSHIFTGLLTGFVATETLSKSLTGHFTNENPKGHEFEVQIAPNVYVSLFRGGIGDLLKLAGNIQDKGAAQGIAQFSQGKLSPLLRTAVGLASGTQYTGQKINNPNDSFAQKSLNEAKFIATSALPIPIGASSVAKYISDTKKTGQPTNPLIAATLGTGVSRFTKSSNGLSNQQQAHVQQLVKNGASKEEQQANVQFFLTAKKSAQDRTKANKAIDAALAAKDTQKAQQLASDYNKKYVSTFKDWVSKYGKYSNATLNKEYKSRKINLTAGGIKARIKAQRNPI